MKSNSNVRKYLQLAVMCMCAVVFFQIIYLRWTFYDAVLALSGLTNAEFGFTMSVFGIIGLICYLPGGIIADRIQPRVLISASLPIVGICGIWLTFGPNYVTQLIIYSIMAFASNLLFWSALMKATRMLEAKDGKGKMFGLLEGGRGVLQTLTSLAFVFLFGLALNEIDGIKLVLIGYSVLNFIFAIIAFFTLEKEDLSKTEKQERFKASDVIKVLKMPGIWLISIVIITCYSVHLCSTYMTPYFTNIIGASASLAAVLAIFRNYILQFLGGPLGGFLAEKLKSTSKVVTGAFVMMVVGAIALVVIPSSPDMMIMLFVTLILICGSVYIMRGIYFALISEIGVSIKLTGTAIGAVSMIGFAPDIFMNPICGALIDSYPGAEGYHIIFLITLGLAVAGLVSSAILYGMSKKKEALSASEDQAEELQGAEA